ncbi:haloacid dehalogenase-like hydrolase domain-containing protein 3 [Lineus longissimus]|uniref:haloacid dehalogenase-like hydrolase domain-containing protein 3 n=1 Tax=Lineus longissimus TaxID=88925 RepID=UPI00315DC85E
MGLLRLVTFDITNTIIRPRDVGLNYSNAAKMFGIFVNPEGVTNSFRKHIKKQDKQYPNYGFNHGMTSKQWWTRLVCDTFLDLNMNHDVKKLHQVADYLFEFYHKGEPYDIIPHSMEPLERLREEHPYLKVGVISNFDERLPAILDDLHLSKYFDFLVLSVKVGVCKPHQRIFQAALEMAGAKPADAVHVGDNIELDYLAARKVGMNAIVMAGKQMILDQRVEDRHVVRDLTELEEKMKLIEEWRI